MAGIDFDDLRLESGADFTSVRDIDLKSGTYTTPPSDPVIIDYRPDLRINLLYDRETKKYHNLQPDDFEGSYHFYGDEGKVERSFRENGEFKREKADPLSLPIYEGTKVGMFIPDSWNESKAEDRFVSGSWHVLGASLIKNENRLFLASLDEGSYFLAELKGSPKTVEDAFLSMQPDVVTKAVVDGKEVKRQGEWFFIKVSDTRHEFVDSIGISLSAFSRECRNNGHGGKTPLPQRDNPDGSGSNTHETTIFKHDGKLYCTGKVYHRDPNTSRLSRQHATVDLGDAVYEAHINVEVQSWSMDGSFD
jgi:hypothetical protein